MANPLQQKCHMEQLLRKKIGCGKKQKYGLFRKECRDVPEGPEVSFSLLSTIAGWFLQDLCYEACQCISNIRSQS